jgi:cobalt-zinc-cadmium efflux system membrane fusion protein
MKADPTARPRPRRGALPRGGIAASLATMLGLATTLAHEGHAPLPTKGVVVQGKQVLLSPKAREAIGVEAEKVSLRDLDRTARARALVQLPWDRQTLITTLVSGRIAAVAVRPGDPIEAGRELARVDSMELETLQRDLLRAIAEQSLARRLLDQREELGRRDAIANVIVLESRRDAAEATAKVEVAARKLLALGMSREALDRVRATGAPIAGLPILSPIRGTLVHADVRAGQVVSPNDHLFHVVDLSEVEIAGEVAESDAAQVAVGQPISATMTALPADPILGAINHVHLSIDPKTRALAVLARVANPGGILRPGMTGQMEIRIARTEQAIACPVAAIAGDHADPFVLLERSPGTYERRPVRLGIRSGGRVEILDGLFPGDRAVVAGTNLLASFLAPKGSAPTSPGLAIRAGSGPHPAGLPGEAPGSIAVAQASIELPVGRKQVVASQVPGRVSRILVHPGDRVRAGQVLAEVESLPLRTIQLDLLLARTRLEWTEQSVRRLRSLRDQQAAPRVELWQEEGALEVLNQQIGEYRSKLLALGVSPEALARLERMNLSADDGKGAMLETAIPIRAGADGLVDHFSLVPGQVIRPSDALFEVHDRSRIWVCGHVRERDAARVRVGQMASVTVAALGDEVRTGPVARIAPVLEEPSRMLPVWIELENPGERLIEGMLARAAIAVPPAGTDPPATAPPPEPPAAAAADPKKKGR